MPITNNIYAPAEYAGRGVPLVGELPTGGLRVGECWVAADTLTMYIWDGAAWQVLSSGGGGGTVLAVSNVDGSLTVAPVTGNVVASLNVGHSNTWTATQTFPEVGVGAVPSEASAILEVTSTTQGVLFPRMTTAERDLIVAPATGLFIYNTTTNKYNYYDGVAWTEVGGGGGGGTAASITVDTSTFDVVPITATNQQLYDNAVDDILALLIPPPPVALSTRTITVLSPYAAYEAGALVPTLHSYCTDDTTPASTSAATFNKGDTGDVLSAWVDGASTGSRILTKPASDVGTYGNLVISADVDPYAGIPGQQGFWKALTANINSVAVLTYASHTFQLRHTSGGNTPLHTFWVDNPGVTTVSGTSYSFPVYSTNWVSGVPSLAVGSTFRCNFTINNAVGKHYNSVKIATVTGTGLSGLSALPPASPPAEGAPISYTNANVATTGTATESLTATVTGFNSKDVSGTPSNIVTAARVDNSSDSPRVEACTPYTTWPAGTPFPAAGYGGAFDSTNTLKDGLVGTEYIGELQMLNGRFQFPSGNYTLVEPVAGPDYSSGMGATDRFVMFQPVSLVAASAFTLNILNSDGGWGALPYNTATVRIYAKVQGATFWVNCNKAYGGVGNPGSAVDDDGAVAVGWPSESGVLRRITFGSPIGGRTGLLYVAIGLSSASARKFGGISITQIT